MAKKIISIAPRSDGQSSKRFWYLLGVILVMVMACIAAAYAPQVFSARRQESGTDLALPDLSLDSDDFGSMAQFQCEGLAYVAEPSGMAHETQQLLPSHYEIANPLVRGNVFYCEHIPSQLSVETGTLNVDFNLARAAFRQVVDHHLATSGFAFVAHHHSRLTCNTNVLMPILDSQVDANTLIAVEGLIKVDFTPKPNMVYLDTEADKPHVSAILSPLILHWTKLGYRGLTDSDYLNTVVHTSSAISLMRYIAQPEAAFSSEADLKLLQDLYDISKGGKRLEDKAFQAKLLSQRKPLQAALWRCIKVLIDRDDLNIPTSIRDEVQAYLRHVTTESLEHITNVVLVGWRNERWVQQKIKPLIDSGRFNKVVFVTGYRHIADLTERLSMLDFGVQ